MTLAAWLDQQKLSPSDFAARINRPQPTIQRYVSGKRIPEPEIMALIVEATGGAVTPNDFYGVGATAHVGAAS
jgi:transcriptional regulator with XRE-family HTH domain